MLAKKYRLKSAKEIENVFKQGKSTRSGFLFLNYCGNNLSCCRIAFSVGIKYSKKAIDRNRAKRLLREEMKQYLGRLAPGFDIVVYLGQVPPGGLTKKVIGYNVKKALSNINLINQ